MQGSVQTNLSLTPITNGNQHQLRGLQHLDQPFHAESTKPLTRRERFLQLQQQADSVVAKSLRVFGVNDFGDEKEQNF